MSSMDFEEPLKESIYAHIDQVKDWRLASFTKEEDFIDEVVDTLDNFRDSTSAQSAQIKAKKMHPSPKVAFPGPNWRGSRRAINAANWIASTDAEFADLMLISNKFEGGTVTERRVMISQTKFSKKSSKKPWEWKIMMHQFHLLHELPEIEFVQPPTGRRFKLTPENKTFRTYSFASDFHYAFFNSTDKMRDFMSSTSGVKSTRYDPTPDAPYGFEVFRGILKRFILGMYGERFQRGDEIGRLIQHMYQNASFDRGKSPSALPDGGLDNDYEDPGMAVVQIDYGKEVEQSAFDDLDNEGPRL